MGELLDKLAAALSKDNTPSPEYNPNVPSTLGQELTKHMNGLLADMYSSANTAHPSSIFAPNPQYNVTDQSLINKDQEALQGWFGNAWNDFLRGIDMTQMSTAKGKMEMDMFGNDGPSAVVDNYDGDVKRLTEQHTKGILNDGEFSTAMDKLSRDYEKAQSDMANYQGTVDVNAQEMLNEPVSKEFMWKSAITQSKGDQASLWDKVFYTAPNTSGSSMALMLPTLAATFGNKVTQALIKSAITEFAGPEVGIPAQIAAVAGAFIASLGELTYGRLQETYGEISGAVDQVRQDLVSKYMKEHGLDDASKIPAEDMKQIRIQSRKGMKQQYLENMALVLPDVLGAMLMPLGNFGTGLSKLGKLAKGIEDTKEAVKDYNKVTRLMSTAGEFYGKTLQEKFEEGFQQAAQYRAQDAAINGEQYQNNGILRNIMEDGYDVAASLNYSIIPGLDLRGDGRYSQDKAFQFSENSGGILGVIMGGIPTSIAIAKDLVAYKQANQDLQKTGLKDIDGGFKRLQNSIMIKYFDQDRVHHLGEAIKSLVNKKDENGNPMLTREDAQKMIQDMRDTYEVYDAVTSRLDGIKDKRIGSTADLKAGKMKLKEDLINVITNIRDKKKVLEELQAQASEQITKDQELFEATNPEAVSARQEMEARKEGINQLKEKAAEIRRKANGINDLFWTHNWEEHVQSIEDEADRKLAEAEQFAQDNEHNLSFAPSQKLIDLYQQIAATQVFLAANTDKLRTLSTMKTAADVRRYNLENNSKPTAQQTTTNTAEPEAQHTVEGIAEKIKNGGTLSNDEEQFRQNNAQAVEDVLKQARAQAEPEVNITPEEETALDNADAAALKDMFTPKTNTPFSQRGQMVHSYLKNNLGGDMSLISFPDFYNGISNLFASNPSYVKDNFDAIQETYRAVVPGSPYFELTVSGQLAELSAIPPVQKDDIDLNDASLEEYRKLTEDAQESQDKIISGLSLAQKNVRSIKFGYGSYGDYRENGMLQFSDQHDQQLGNTSEVLPGDVLEVGIDKMPEGFDISNTSDENYDRVEIGVYKNVEVADGITKRMLLFHLHRVDRLDELLADTVNGQYPLDKEKEKELLRINRRLIIEAGPDAVFHANVLSKGFGRLNTNAKGASTTIAQAVGNDKRVILSYVDNNGDPVPVFGETLATRGGMIKGATILLVPNSVGVKDENGLFKPTYVPLYVAKRQLKEDPDGIQDIVYKAIDEYLTYGTRKSLDKAAPYVYLTSVEAQKTSLGVKGIYAANRVGTEVMVNNRVFTPTEREGLREAIGEVYFSIDKNFLKDEEYQDRLMKSPVLQTSISANPILRERFQSGEYGFLKGGEQNSYFSQHTITIGSIAATKEEAAEDTTINEVPPSDSDQFLTLLGQLDDIDVTPPKMGKLAKLAQKLGQPVVKFWDDLSSGARKSHLVSPEIPASLQHDMVNALAFNLINAERPTDDETDNLKNVDRAKAWVIAEHTKYASLANSLESNPNATEANKQRAATIVNNYRLFNEHFDGILEKAKQLIDSLGYKYDENTDYYENLEDEGEDNSFNQFNDDANSTTDPTEFLPKEVKKLMYFIPALQPLNPQNAVDKAYIDQMVKAGHPAPTYRETRNSTLVLPYFNNFNDTWEKTLEVTTMLFFDATNTGFQKMLNLLSHKNNAPVVQELAKRLAKAPEQVQNAFFRRTKLQKQVNISSLYDAKQKKKGSGKRKFLSIFQSDSKQGVKKIFSDMQDEFLNSNTGLLVAKRDEATGHRVLTVNIEYAKQIKKEIDTILDNHLELQKSTGKVSPLSETDRTQIYYLIRNLGIKFSREAFEDLLKFYKTTAAGSSKDTSVIREVFSERIIKRLAGEARKSAKNETEEAEEGSYDDLRGNNPFIDERNALNAIARQEIKYRQQTQTGSYYFERKSYYAFTRPNYISEFFQKIKEFKLTGVDSFIQGKLATDTYAKNSIYLNGLLNPKVDMGLELFYELGSRNKASDNPSKLLKNMNPREHLVTRLGWFQNKGEWKAYYMWDTLSDKTTKPVVTARRYDVSDFSYDNTGGIKLSTANIDRLYTAHFLNEVARVNQTIQQNKSLSPHELIKGYHDIGKKEGMGKYLLTFYFLNKAWLEVTNPKLAQDMYNADGSFKTIDNAMRGRIMKEISDHMNRVIQKNKLDMKELGLYDLDAVNDKGYPAPDLVDLLDHNYMFTGDNSIERRLGLEKTQGMRSAFLDGDWSRVPREVLERIVDYVVTDYVYNSVLFSNEMILLTGDPAQAGKLASKQTINAIKEKHQDNPAEAARQILLANIESTYVNLGKRNAAFLASGELGKFKDSYYNVAIADDLHVNSEHLEYYKSLFPDNESGVEDAYGENEKMTDAQEVTTVKEFLSNMEAYGKIDADKYAKALYMFDKEQYDEDLKKGLVKEVRPSSKERFELFNLVMQPQKPVQRTYNPDDKLGISKQYYIKTSAYPLIPGLVEGAMADLLRDMKKNDIHRVAFVSGVKQGVAGSKPMFNADGTYNTKFFENNKNTLHRNGFRIQLEVPFKESKNQIREGTQQSKLLFVDIPETTQLDYRGAKASVKELRNKYIDYHKQIIALQRQKLMHEIGVSTKRGVTTMDLTKLSAILQREAEGRGYALNSILGLDLMGNEFKVPLTFLPNAGQIEPVITALVSNNITRLKMPGKSYVQGSEFMLKTGRKGTVESDERLKDRRDIIWTKPEYEGMEKLQYLHKDDEGKVHNAQIIMPFYFVKGHDMLDVKDFIKTVDGRTYLDTDKVDPELLQMNGFRIPFQGLNSGMWFEIVGFLPKTAGDLVIVPAEIAGQMGSDYDVDKLYSYMYNYKFRNSYERLGADDAEYQSLVADAEAILEKRNEPKDKKGRYDKETFNKALGEAVNNKYPDGNVPKHIYTAKERVASPGIPLETSVFQGRNTEESDSRDYNYYTTSEEEAKGYGNHVEKKDLKLKNVLEKLTRTKDGELEWSPEFERLHDEFRAQEGHGFDVLDNSVEGLVKQNKFFKFLESKGYDGLSLTTVAGKITEQDDNRYIISFAHPENQYAVPKFEITKIDAEEPKSVEELQNALIDIQKAVYTSADDMIHKSILEPQSFTDLEETVNYLSGGKQSEFIGAFDPVYQREVYFSNSTGKLGTAISANNNTSHAQAQVSNLFIKGDGFMFLDEEGNMFSDHLPNYHDTNSVNEITEHTYLYSTPKGDVDQNDAKNRSAWRLDKIWTFPDPVTGKRYRISNLLNQLLGVSVDNAKEQKLGALGVNRINFNIAEAIIRAGFSPNYMSAFINQPILKEYYEKIGETEDIYNVDYTPNKRQKAIDDLYNKYISQFRLQNDIPVNPVQLGFKLSDMVNWMNTGITAKNAAEQMYILKAFLRYKDISDGIQSLTSVFNIDAKGLPKNISETIEKARKISTMDEGHPKPAKAVVVLGNVNSYRYQTIPGLFLNVPSLAVQVFANPVNGLFAYNSAAYKKVTADLLTKTGRAEFNQDQLDIIHNHIKQFVYTGFEFPGMTTLRQERESLLFDTPENESIQTRLERMQEKYPRNDFLTAIKAVGSIYPDNPKLIDMPFSSEENYTQKVSEFWEQAIYGHDQDLAAFAKDLVKYALLVAPQEYGQINLIRYIPFRYRDEIGFHKYLRDVASDVADADTLHAFTDQFLQHRIDFVLSAREQNFMPGTMIRNNDTIESFYLPPINPATLAKNPAASLVREDEDGMLYYPEFLAVFNSKEVGKQLYRKSTVSDGTVAYHRVEKKGLPGMSEYDTNNALAQTIVATNKISYSEPIADSTLVANAMGTADSVFEIPTTDFQEVGEYLKEGAKADDMLRDMIAVCNNIIISPTSTEENKKYARMYQFLAAQLQFTGLNGTNIILDEEHPTAASTLKMSDGSTTVVFNPVRMGSSNRSGLTQELERQRTILHEFLHVALYNAVKTKRETPEYKAVEDVWNAYKDNIYKSTGDVRGIPVDVFDAELFSMLKKRYDDKADDLGTSDYITFVSSLINNPETVNSLMAEMGERLAMLHHEGKIKKANFDLLGNTNRANDFRDYVVNNFMSKLKDMTNRYYGYYDLEEFVSEALTNKETQNILRQMPSIWQQLVSAIKRFLDSIFGITDSERNLMNDAFDAVMNLLSDGEKGLSLRKPNTPMTPVNAQSLHNFSGGAQGADLAWDRIGREFGVENHTHFRPENITSLPKDKQEYIEAKYIETQRALGRNYVKADTFAGGLLRRDYLQVAYADAVFAISRIVYPGETDKGYTVKSEQVSGGTGYAVQMAINDNKPVYVFDQNRGKWFTWDTTTRHFVETDTPTLTPKFAGVGTREINELGLQAIRSVYSKTLSQAPVTKEVRGINIATNSSDELGRALTNPTWGSKRDGHNYFDVETNYKRQKSTSTNPEEALAEDMFTMYNLINKKFETHPELVDAITQRGGRAFLEASSHIVGVKGSRWEGKGLESNFIAVLTAAYEQQMALRGIRNTRADHEPGSQQNPHKMTMGFKDGTGGRMMRSEFRGKSTMDLILSGDRTATSRDLKKDYNNMDIRPGDYILMEGDNKEALVQAITGWYDVANVSPLQWSKLEGWDTSGYAKVYDDEYSQFQFRLLPQGIPLEEEDAPFEHTEEEPADATDTFQYFGAKYDIQINADGYPYNVVGYKGSNKNMQKILQAYMDNPDVDPQNGKAFRNSPKAQTTVDTEEGRTIKLPNGKTIRFNDQQWSALGSIKEWLKTGKGGDLYTLSGYAGTGKTTLTIEAIKGFRGQVAVSAPTHKAKTVIGKATGKDAVTIHSLLGIRKNLDLADYNPRDPRFDPIGEKLIGEYQLIVVDEASMLNKDLFHLLVSEAKKNGTKVLFMGDEAQLPPVGERKSIVFTEVKNQSLLTKVERQADDNPLMFIYDAIRNNLDSVKDAFQHVTRTLLGKGISFTKNAQTFGQRAINAFLSEEYKTDKNFVKLLTFTNDSVKQWNNTIRTAMFGDKVDPLVKGDLLMAYQGIGQGDDAIANSSDHEVMDVKRQKVGGIDVYTTLLRDIDDKSEKEVNFIVMEPQNVKAYVDMLKYYEDEGKRKGGKAWREFYAFKERYVTMEKIEGYPKDFDYGYAITIHKSQGSTYKYVFVDENNIDMIANPNRAVNLYYEEKQKAEKNGTLADFNKMYTDSEDYYNKQQEMKNSLKYVAFSRPTDAAIVLSNKTADKVDDIDVESRIQKMIKQGLIKTMCR